ncbi:hypothetical protein LEN26_008161 [Aphanomyces euteiches]|nr:hypothetical protein LEN26_020465 [Aphanomyces euteiches]KAH9130832.1 hypothetical protein LEN26_008161 [Aphanomyces euteiches]
MKLIQAMLAMIYAVGCAVAQDSVDAKVKRAADFIQNQLVEAKIPGMAISVVYQNKTVLAQGFGTKEFGNPDAPVLDTTLCQIGSNTKTFIAVALAKLKDDNKLNWTDPVVKHLPWFQLYDKYAQKLTTIQDFLTHNSVFGNHEGDLPANLGGFGNERQSVEALKYLETSPRVGAGFAYSNLGYNVLGQVIEAISGQTWHDYLRDAIWTPLGMTSTYGYADAALLGNVLGAMIFVMELLLVRSILSSAKDMATFSKFILAKGSPLFKSSAVISELVTGHHSYSMTKLSATLNGYEFEPDGNAVAAGYGFDIVGQILFGHHYFTKNGAMVTHRSQVGYVPDAGLAVTVMWDANHDKGFASEQFRLSWMTSYLAGIFLDVNQTKLSLQFQSAMDSSNKLIPFKTCDAHFFGGKPWPSDNNTVGEPSPWVGKYTPPVSGQYYGTISITQDDRGKLNLQYGKYNSTMVLETKDNYILTTAVAGPITRRVLFSKTASGAPVLQIPDYLVAVRGSAVHACGDGNALL